MLRRPAPPRPALMALAPLALLTLGACGSDARTYAEPLALAAAIDCASTYTEGTSVPGSAASGTCSVLDGEQAELARLFTFDTDALRDAYVSAAVPDGSVFVVGPEWAVEVESEEAAMLVVDATGGETRSGG